AGRRNYTVRFHHGHRLQPARPVTPARPCTLPESPLGPRGKQTPKTRPPRDRAEAVCNLLHLNSLEGELGGDLQRSRPAGTEEGIADAHVARGREAQSALRRAVGVDSVWRGVGDERRQERACEVRVVQEVVGLKAQLELQTLGERGVLEKREIELPEVR